MIITTSTKPTTEMTNKAQKIAQVLNGTFVQRGDSALQSLINKFNKKEVIVVEKELTKYYPQKSSNPFFFHPNLAVLRIKRIQEGDNDIMVKIAELKAGDSFLDCTLGLATDAIVASHVVGEKGQVWGFESNAVLAVIVKEGLAKGHKKHNFLNLTMQRIKVETTNHYEGLRGLPDKSFDVVYFDPMFRVGLNNSALKPLREIANQSPISKETIAEAKRVAKRLVLLKENKLSGEFERLGFRRIPRANNVTYGVIRLSGDVRTNEG